MSPKTFFCICNAHLDPVWLWPWQEGMAEALSTFAIAADFCEEFDGFIFNHNESLLYEWVEKYDPTLFARIRKLVESGRWHITGGSYLQPDLNGPSGETHIREFLLGLEYFKSRFNQRPRTAYNFDSFGHPEGYASILAGCGFDSYIFTRPDFGTFDLPAGPFIWCDRNGAKIKAVRAGASYTSTWGLRKLFDAVDKNCCNEENVLFLWGIGNHGGGPSREEYAELAKIIEEKKAEGTTFKQSYPEEFFSAHKDKLLPEIHGEFQNSFPGCYTSMAGLKSLFRESENQVLALEQLATLAWWLRDIPYPKHRLTSIWRDVCFAAFHDILPGSAVQNVENQSLTLLSRTHEELTRLEAELIFTLLAEEPAPVAENVSVFVWNKHAHSVQATPVFEYITSHRQFQRDTLDLFVYDDQGNLLPVQREKDDPNLSNDWRVRLAVSLTLAPNSFTRLTCQYKKRETPIPWHAPIVPNDTFVFGDQEGIEITLNMRTGFPEFYAIDGNTQFLYKDSLVPTVFADTNHSWTCGHPKTVKNDNYSEGPVAPPWKEPVGTFTLATPQEAATICARPKGETLPPIRIIEDGHIRTIIEGIYVYQKSYLVRKYIFNKTPQRLEIEDLWFWAEKDSMLKLAVPLAFSANSTVSDRPHSSATISVGSKHVDHPNQSWVVAVSAEDSRYFGIASGECYGHSLYENTLYINVLRSPAYASFGLNEKDERISGRFLPRQQQGSHTARYTVCCGKQFSETDCYRVARLHAAPPRAMVLYPRGKGVSLSGISLASISNPQVALCALKQGEDGCSLVARFRELAGSKNSFTFHLGNDSLSLDIEAWELLTIKIQKDGQKIKWLRINLVEESQ